jgi:adenine-specific DNA-methyltransferase
LQLHLAISSWIHSPVPAQPGLSPTKCTAAGSWLSWASTATHIIPRLKKVIDGEDQGGISRAVNWKGGGGFRYYRLAPSLLQQDRWGQWVINKDYNAEMLAEAICKLEGFTYAPSDAHYWQHGKSTENDFIYVTTQSLTPEQLQALSDEVGEGRSLLVCCSAFRGDANRYPNLTVKKIPKMVLSRCEWGHDDYSLNVKNLPMASSPEPTVTAAAPASNGRKGAKSVDAGQAGLFDVSSSQFKFCRFERERYAVIAGVRSAG